MNIRFFPVLVFILALTAPCLWADEVTLIDKGVSKVAIHVAPETMALDNATVPPKKQLQEMEKQRQRLRESVKDLAHYLEKMSGAKVEILTKPSAQDPRLPILIGESATVKWGAPEKTAPFKQGFRVVASREGIGLAGESDLATSYAIYELLDRLGCRWFMPSELGEVIPVRKTVVIPECDDSLIPGTVFRNIWYADDAYKRRNRLGGLLLQAGHALEMYFGKEERDAHPDWKATLNGNPDDHRLQWSSQGVADCIADKIIVQQKNDPARSWSLSPDDGMNFSESAEDRKLDAGDWDEVFGQISITDRLMVLCNRIIRKVDAQDPDILYGVLAYSQYVRPPVRERVPHNLVPQLAPITYARAHPMTDDNVPGNQSLQYSVEGWGRAAKMVSYYFYGWFLAETTAPNPMIAKWSADLPFIYENNCQFWQPETICNFETSMHALYLGNRMAWNPDAKPAEIIEELNRLFYGKAAPQMTAYWNYIDDVWVKTPEYSGCGFAYRRRFTPAVMKKARQLLDQGKAACETVAEKERVAMADESLKLFELFMKLREDLAAGRFATLENDAKKWVDDSKTMGARYEKQYAFGKMPWSGDETIGIRYFTPFYQVTYKDATRIARDFEVLTTPPIGPFRFQVDKEKKGEALDWFKPGFDDKSWKTCDPSMDSLSALGHHDYFGPMWYRVSAQLPSIPAGKKVYLWIGGTDGTAKVFVNGNPVPYVDDKGKEMERIEGYCQPFSWNITDAIKPGAENQITILSVRTGFNELGTGGLIAPVVVYREK